MKRCLGLLLLMLAVNGTVATAEENDFYSWKAATGKDDGLYVTLSGKIAEKLYGQLTAPATQDWEDGLISAIYETRQGKQLSCTRSIIPGARGDWSYSCRFAVAPDGSIQPGH